MHYWSFWVQSWGKIWVLLCCWMFAIWKLSEKKEKKRNSVSRQCPVLEWNYYIKVDMARETCCVSFYLFILLSWLNGKFYWHGTNSTGPVNVSIVEIMTPVWNVSLTDRVNPCFVWGCAWSFRSSIMPSRLCLNHLTLNVMCADRDSYPWQPRAK